jgi:DNA-binding transcriptional regulator YhcF (GntR family)
MPAAGPPSQFVYGWSNVTRSGARPPLRLGAATDVVFAPIRSGNTFEETVERILQAIKVGVVAYGERLPGERDLAERLAISRVTLREAIRSLQLAGYVESRRGPTGGTFATSSITALSKRSWTVTARQLAPPWRSIWTPPPPCSEASWADRIQLGALSHSCR